MSKIFFFILFSLFANSLEIRSISEKEKSELGEIDPQNFDKESIENQFFIGKTGKYHYIAMEKYGRYVEENFSKSKIYFKKYKDYLDFKKFKNFIFPKFYIKSDRKNIETEIVGIKEFYQGIRLKRDQKYKIILKSENKKVEKEILFIGQEVVLNFGDSFEIKDLKNENSKFMFEKDPRFLGTWKESKKYCKKLKQDSFSDWRLPTLLELWHVKNRETDKNYPKLSRKEFWSGDKKSKNLVWGVDLKTGSDKLFKIHKEKKAFCVRGDSNYKIGKLEKYGEVLLDPENSLMWDLQNRKESWKNSRIICLNSEKEGFEDWRVPTIKELYTIRNSKIKGRFWSGTTFFENYRKAWGLNIDSKKDTWSNKQTTKRDVICVRNSKDP